MHKTLENYAGLQFIAAHSTIFDSLESFLSHLRPAFALYEGHCSLYSVFLLLVSKSKSFLGSNWQLSLYYLINHS